MTTSGGDLALPPGAKKTPQDTKSGGVFEKTGDTYFRTFGTIIGSESLTAVFGMGTGVAFPICSPEEAGGPGRARRLEWFSCGEWVRRQ